MRVNVMTGDSNELFRALVYQPPTADMVEYMQNTIAKAGQAIGNAGSTLVSNAQQLFSRFNSEEAIIRSKNLINQASTHVSENVIYAVNPSSIGRANLEMQQWIMEEPNVQRLYKKQMLDGFSQTYFDYCDSQTPPEERPQYMQVTDGVMSTEAYGDLETTFYTYTHEDRKTIDRYDRMAILDSWRVARNMICDDVDPTELT